MGPPPSLSWTATLSEYQQQATRLLELLHAGDTGARWLVKWQHPRFRDTSVDDVAAALLDIDDARTVTACAYAFQDWEDLVRFTGAVARDQSVTGFEQAVEAVVAGDLASLTALLHANPELVRAQSVRRHRATLLHYVAANGVEDARQRTPANAVAVATTLLDAGAEVDALADMYEARCTTMSMLVSSSPPAEAGLQTAIAETLLDHGAAFVGPGSKWQSALMTALAFGFPATARMLAARGAPIDRLAAAAGLDRLDEARRLLPQADSHERHVALALAAYHGQLSVLRLLLDAGEDPDRYNPDGYHAHSTPLHQAVCANHPGVVRLLIERGARTDLPDTIYRGTPLGWAVHFNRQDIAEYLRRHGASET